jgi:hypothetical protein
MAAWIRIGLLAVLVLGSSAAGAESLRCSGGIASEGDSRMSVVHKCGQPTLKDSFCAPVYYGNSLFLVPEPFASAYVPCQQTDAWLYDRGPGNLVATVRFRSGIVQSITYGRQPR